MSAKVIEISGINKGKMGEKTEILEVMMLGVSSKG